MNDRGGAWTLERFRALIETYGGDARRWPDDVRDAAQSFAATSDAARAELAAAQRLDTALDEVRPPPASPELRARLSAMAVPTCNTALQPSRGAS